MNYSVGDTVYYKQHLFKIVEATIIKIKETRCVGLIGAYCEPYTKTEYLIRLKNGRLKIVTKSEIF